MNTSKAVIYREHGKPLEVLELDELSLPEVSAGKVKVRLLAACVNPSDFGMILGSYGKLKTLPAVAGREGIGEIVEVGEGVNDVKVGDWVRFPEDAGTWQSAAVVPAQDLWVIPNDLSVEMAAMLFVNPPTAWRILRDAHLDDGAWVIQNAANSAVGLFVIQMAKVLGLKTLNVVRREELVQPLLEMGADIVVTEESGYEKKVKDLTQGGRVLLGLNSIGGESAIRLVKSLSNGGSLITIGAMTFEEVRFPTRYLIFNDISLRGFWLDRWMRENSKERVQVMFDRLYGLIREGKLQAPIAATYSLDDFRAALKQNNQPRLGKVLLKP